LLESYISLAFKVPCFTCYIHTGNLAWLHIPFMTLSVQIEYIVKQSMPKDGKLLAIGHSMGGILLYSMLSRFGEFIASLVLICHCHVAFICYCILFLCVLCLTFVIV